MNDSWIVSEFTPGSWEKRIRLFRTRWECLMSCNSSEFYSNMCRQKRSGRRNQRTISVIDIFRSFILRLILIIWRPNLLFSFVIRTYRLALNVFFCLKIIVISTNTLDITLNPFFTAAFDQRNKSEKMFSYLTDSDQIN